MKKFIKKNWFKLSILLLIVVVIGIACYYFFSFNQRNGHDDIAGSFKCPESYTIAQDQLDSVAKFISDYSKIYPNATVGEMNTYRYHLLVSHSCTRTLENMLQNIAPITQMLRFEGKDFGPQMTNFTKSTGVWSSFFVMNNQNSDNPDEELIFNFYLKNIWKTGMISSEEVAQVVANSYGQSNTSEVIYKFTAPDTITKNPDFFIFSDIIYPDQGYGYLYITKISSLQDSVFSVTYSKKFTGASTDLIKKDITDWLAQDLKLDNGYTKEIGNIEVDPSWLEYFASKQ